MLGTMRHRAPDGFRVVSVPDFEMGMGRLAVIDLDNDDYPFAIDGYTLSFNGELYNYLELREELITMGHAFRTNTDTEVVLQAYIAWGQQCLDKFNGMFALAIHHDGQVFLARDIAGEKPLYYSTYRGFRFASEAKALDWQCTELPPAHYGIFNLKTNAWTAGRWWKFTPRTIDLEHAERELELLIEDSIRLRTRSDVPYALYLSDGIDSNLINSFHDFAKTYTYDDQEYSKEDFEKTIRQIVWHLDYPLDSFSSFALWNLAKTARADGFKVVLSGEGADELFGGYVRYVPRGLNLKAQKEFPSYPKLFPVEKEDPGFHDFNGKMKGLLRMGDRMASAHGIENRCPFLDRRIIEFAFSLPDELRCYGFDTKVILKRILKKRNPSFQEKEKHGLFVRVNEHLGGTRPFSKGAYLALQNQIWQTFQ